MKINSEKSKEMIISCAHGSIGYEVPNILIEGKVVERVDHVTIQGWVSRSQIVSQNLRSICDKHTIKLRLEKRVTGKDRKMQQHRGHFEYQAIAYMVDLR